MEIGFISVNKLRLEILNKKGSWSGKILSNHLKNPGKFIAATLIGNNITLVIYGILMGKFLGQFFPEFILANPLYNLLTQTLISTIIVLFAGEFIPKVLFQLKAVPLLKTFAPLFQLIYILIWPILMIFLFLSNKILHLLHQNAPTDERVIFGSKDLGNFLKETDDKKFEKEFNVDPKLLENVLEFKDVKIRECMVPRTEMVAFELNGSMEHLRQLFLDSRHSRILIYQEDIDNIVGYIHHFALLEDNEDIKKVLIPIMVVPEAMNATDLLDAFIDKHKGIAWVVDEFGGTAGMVTLEDLLEEIIGEIEDEYDDEDLLDKKISDSEFLFSARLEIDFLNDKYELDFPEGDYETLAGLLLSESETILKKGDKVRIGKYLFTILDSTRNKIEKVKLNLL